ncbi:hypothetical protein G9A89_013811 [Geosiphon pyriformis]|nr:hypothetical protein G9A89_013811 [Geosiphon pyriformis]
MKGCHSLPKLTTELIIRFILGISILLIIVFMTIPNFFKLLVHQDTLVSISINKDKSETGIPAPNALLCPNETIFPYLKGVEFNTFESQAENSILLSSVYIDLQNYTSSPDEILTLREINEKSKCLAFVPDGRLIYTLKELSFVELNVYQNEQVNKNTFGENAEFGTIWVTYDPVNNTYQERDSVKIKLHYKTNIDLNPTERIDVHKKSHWYKSVPERLEEFPLPQSSISVKIRFYPINFLVTQYTEKNEVTWIDLFTGIGGLFTYASGLWKLLFGRGRFKSWGIIQQYILKTAPNANKRRREKIQDSPILPIQTFSKNLYSSSEQSQSDTLNSTPTLLYVYNSGKHFRCNFDNTSEKSSISGESSYSEKSIHSCNRIPKIALDFGNTDERTVADNLKVLQREVKLIEKLLNKEYLEGFDLETFDKINRI